MTSCGKSSSNGNIKEDAVQIHLNDDDKLFEEKPLGMGAKTGTVPKQIQPPQSKPFNLDELEGTPIERVITALEKSMMDICKPGDPDDIWDFDQDVEALPVVENLRREQEIYHFWHKKDQDFETRRYQHVRDYAAIQRMMGYVADFRKEKRILVNRLIKDVDKIVVRQPNTWEAVNEVVNAYATQPPPYYTPAEKIQHEESATPLKEVVKTPPKPKKKVVVTNPYPRAIPSTDSEDDKEEKPKVYKPTAIYPKNHPVSITFTPKFKSGLKPMPPLENADKKRKHGKGKGLVQESTKFLLDRHFSLAQEQCRAHLPTLLALIKADPGLLRKRFGLKPPILYLAQEQYTGPYTSRKIESNQDKYQVFVAAQMLRPDTAVFATLVPAERQSAHTTFVIYNHNTANGKTRRCRAGCTAHCKKPIVLQFHTHYPDKRDPVHNMVKYYYRNPIQLGTWRITKTTPAVTLHVGGLTYILKCFQKTNAICYKAAARRNSAW